MHSGGLKIRKKVQFREVALLLVICGDSATTRVLFSIFKPIFSRNMTMVVHDGFFLHCHSRICKNIQCCAGCYCWAIQDH